MGPMFTGLSPQNYSAAALIRPERVRKSEDRFCDQNALNI
jgi:hypothetical protein